MLEEDGWFSPDFVNEETMKLGLIDKVEPAVQTSWYRWQYYRKKAFSLSGLIIKFGSNS